MQTTNQPLYKSEQLSNLHKLYSKRFLVVGLTRNSSLTIKNDISKISSALSKFENLNWLIIESDSDDKTEKVLEELKSTKKNFRSISLGALSKKIPLRTARIAFCRNKYLEEIKNNNQYKEIEYVIVADLDGINNLITEKGFISCWLEGNWDVCTANQKGPYYDIYALRHPFWSPNDCMQVYKFFIDHNLSAEQSREIAIRSKMIKVNEKSDWIEVESAFGGLAIYRKDAIKDAHYVGIDNSGAEICEHVTFHKMLRENGKRIFINPRFINAAYTEHTIPLKPINRIKEKIKQLVKKTFYIIR